MPIKVHNRSGFVAADSKPKWLTCDKQIATNPSTTHRTDNWMSIAVSGRIRFGALFFFVQKSACPSGRMFRSVTGRPLLWPGSCYAGQRRKCSSLMS